MQRHPDVLEGRLDKIAYPHIRERLQALRHDLPAMLEYVNHLFLDTRDGQRRGFDFTTASTLMEIKHDLMLQLDEYTRLKRHVLPWEQEFRVASPGRPYQPPVKLPKNW
ncbi:hypothetical protein Tsedi_01998 [Tepidimonas sediminis]|uniref:Uncharacterized protein n=1 Tax=Tepidimonas sediminis TaxID=2588941 RepID=A0A554WLA1_9BURK|nr:hypothetical protein [Tepidimonas sediminis]TSE24344.1 hypothetical protein Tsedi_01998 [Tepidimonas sediminis]